MSDSNDDVVINIEEGGTMSFVYRDELKGLLDAGPSVVARVSEVEPAHLYGLAGGGWVADMGRIGGPLLVQNHAGDTVEVPQGRPVEGRVLLRGFPLREQALAAEREWLRREKGL